MPTVVSAIRQSICLWVLHLERIFWSKHLKEVIKFIAGCRPARAHEPRVAAGLLAGRVHGGQRGGRRDHPALERVAAAGEGQEVQGRPQP